MALVSLALVTTSQANSHWPEEGWQVESSPLSYPALLDSLRSAVEAEEMFVVTDVGPTQAAASRGVTIPGNRVVGVFRNDYAVSILRLSVPAMIEAPLRFYVTENDDGTATLAWKIPSHVFAPYRDGAGDALIEIAEELDGVFEAIAHRAIRE
jgi:uncharacterized protein (DUF302 family)